MLMEKCRKKGGKKEVSHWERIEKNDWIGFHSPRSVFVETLLQTYFYKHTFTNIHFTLVQSIPHSLSPLLTQVYIKRERGERGHSFKNDSCPRK